MRTLRPSLGALVGLLVALALAAVGVVAVALLGAAPAAAQADPDRSRVFEPFAAVVTNPCGEDVLVTGEVLVGFAGVTPDAHGGLHGTQLVLLRRVTAVGVASGTPYRVVDLQHAGGTADGGDLAPFGSTEVDSFLLISQGGGANLVSHGTIHYQTDPAGAGRADVSFGRAECVG